MRGGLLGSSGVPRGRGRGGRLSAAGRCGRLGGGARRGAGTMAVVARYGPGRTAARPLRARRRRRVVSHPVSPRPRLNMRIALVNRFHPPDPAPTGRAMADLAADLAAALPEAEVRVFTTSGTYRAGSTMAAAATEWTGVTRIPSVRVGGGGLARRSEEHTSELQ